MENMIKNIITVLIITFFHSFSQLPNLDELTWYSVKNNTMADVWPGEECGHSQRHVLDAWSSGAYDPNRHRMLIFGGGHNDYYGNEIYQFSIDSMKWSIAEKQSTGYLNCGGSCIEVLADGNPNSRHTYDALTFLIHNNKFMMIGGSLGCLSGGGADDSWWWDDANGWIQKLSGGLHYELTKSAVYNPKDSCVYMQDYDGFKKYNPWTNSWSDIGGVVMGGGLCGAIDTSRNWFVNIGDGESYYYDLNEQPQCSKHNLNTTGGSSITNTQNPGVEYDPIADKIVCYAGGIVWSLDLESKSWTSFDINGKPSGSGAAYDYRIYGHFSYMPEYNTYIFIGGNPNDQVYFFKYRLTKTKTISKPRNLTVSP